MLFVELGYETVFVVPCGSLNFIDGVDLDIERG
jgi:hypothetical protein